MSVLDVGNALGHATAFGHPATALSDGFASILGIGWVSSLVDSRVWPGCCKILHSLGTVGLSIVSITWTVLLD